MILFFKIKRSQPAAAPTGDRMHHKNNKNADSEADCHGRTCHRAIPRRHHPGLLVPLPRVRPRSPEHPGVRPTAG
ncbi:hypothetical protein EMIT0P218_110150 [Pseudomonas sp. IT-P218]